MSDDGWIEWTGGPMPVPEDTRVDVRFKDGEVWYDKRAGLWGHEWWKWVDPDPAYHIVAYRPTADDREAFGPGGPIPLTDAVEHAILLLVRLRVALVLGHTDEAKQLAADAKRAVDEVTAG